jgi:hypothetical protein
MLGPYTYSGNFKPIVGVAIAGFVLASGFCNFGAAAQGCNLFNKTAWVALEVLRPVILSGWQSVPACLCGDSWLLQHVLQIVTSIWPLLCVIAG